MVSAAMRTTLAVLVLALSACDAPSIYLAWDGGGELPGDVPQPQDTERVLPDAPGDASSETDSDAGTVDAGSGDGGAGGDVPRDTGVPSDVACPPGRGDCDGDPANGCEADIATVANCGRCGLACHIALGADGCVGGVCVRGPCAGEWANCDGDPANGCEVDLGSPLSCGACWRTCGVGLACSNGGCPAACPLGLTACGGGCRDLTRNNSHCGACGRACAPSQRCVASVCVE